MKKYSIFIMILLVFLLFQGCKLTNSDKVSNLDSQTINASTSENLTEQSDDSDESLEPLIYSIDMVVYETGNISYEIPKDWNTVVKDGRCYYYPTNGGLIMFQCYEEDKNLSNQSEETYKLLLEAVKEGTSQNSKNYEDISSKYFNLSDTIAIDFIYNCHYNDELYVNRTIAFYYGYNLYSITLAQPKELIDNNAFDTILSSITFKSMSPKEDIDHFADIEADADEKIKNTKEITSGDIYESIKTIHKNSELTDTGDLINISIYIDSSNPKSDSELFYKILKEICSKSGLETKYTSVTFTLFINNKLITTLVYLDYYGTTDYVSSRPTILNEDYKDIINNLYDKYDSTYDIETNFNNELLELKDKYHLE